MTSRRVFSRGSLVFFMSLLALCGMAEAAEQAAALKNGEAKGSVASKAVFRPGLQTFLDDILKKNEWKTADVMELVPRLQWFRKDLSDFQHLPNLEALKEKFPNDHTVRILDLYYRYAVHKSYQAVEKDIEQINGWKSDARLVVLAVECAHHLDRRNLTRQLELARRLVELEPENKKFRQSLVRLERQAAKSATAVPPNQQTVPATKLQAQ